MRICDLLRAGHGKASPGAVARYPNAREARHYDLGTRMFEPGSQAWWSAVKTVRPDLFTGASLWERVTAPEAVQKLLSDSGIEGALVTAESGQQQLPSPEDWWTVVLGSGYPW